MSVSLYDEYKTTTTIKIQRGSIEQYLVHFQLSKLLVFLCWHQSTNVTYRMFIWLSILLNMLWHLHKADLKSGEYCFVSLWQYCKQWVIKWKKTLRFLSCLIENLYISQFLLFIYISITIKSTLPLDRLIWNIKVWNVAAPSDGKFSTPNSRGCGISVYNIYSYIWT